MAHDPSRRLAAVSAALSLGALPLFGLYNVMGWVVTLLLSVLRLRWPFDGPDAVVTWVTVLVACVTTNAWLALAGWARVTPGRYRVSVLLLSCFDFAFLLAPGLAKWGAFWGQERQDLTFGPFAECDCAISNPVVNHLAGVWIELQFLLSILAVVAAVATLAVARRARHA